MEKAQSFYNYDDTTLNVFISYCSAFRKHEVRQLAKYLKRKKKLNVWIDAAEIYGSTVDKMSAEGISAADVVIVFYSDAYQNSESCRKEATFADELKKTVLFVRMQRGFQVAPWLAAYLGDNLYVDFKEDLQVSEVAEQVFTKLYQLFDPSWKHNFKEFKPLGIEREQFSEKCYQKLDYQPKLEAIKHICRTATGEGGLLLLDGEEGVGKTYFMSLLLLRPESGTFFTKECNIRTALWLNCYAWRDQKAFLENEDVKAAFKAQLADAFARAARRKLATNFDDHIRILKENFQAPPLVIFDDVFHLPLLSFIRKQCKSLPCLAITRTKFLNEMQSQGDSSSAWDQLSPEIETVRPLATEKIIEMLRETYELDDFDDFGTTELQKLAASSEGLPRQAIELVSKLKNKDGRRATHAKQKQPDTANESESNPAPDKDESRLQFIEVPNFENYFVRADDEDALRNGIKFLASRKATDKGFFLIEGCGGIGKSTLISHVLRDPKTQQFFQSECHLDIFIWLNCYGWREGFERNQDLKESFFGSLLSLGSQADSSVEDGFKHLNQMLEHFSEKSLRILFILDDVFHFSIIQALRTECPSALCCAVTRDASVLTTPSFDPFLKLPDKSFENPARIGYLEHDRVLDILLTDFRLKDRLRREQLNDLAFRCGGLPLIVSLIGGQFRNCADGQYQRVYKKLKEDSSLGNLQVAKTGRGEEKASQLFDVAWKKLTLEDRKRYYAFLFFNPVEQVTDKSFKLLWKCEDIEDVREACIGWERLSLVRRITESWSHRSEESYLIHQILHETAVEKAAQYFHVDGENRGKLFLSQLRIRLLVQNADPDYDNDVANFLTALRRLTEDNLIFIILRLIENDAIKQFLLIPANHAKGNLPCGLCPKDYEDALLGNAAKTGHFYLTEYLMACGCDVNSASSDDGSTPLMNAVTHGQIKIVEFLVSKGAKIDAINNFHNTALILAGFYGHEKIAEFLISNGANVEAVSRNGTNSLMSAASGGYLKIVQLLVAKGANIEVTDTQGCTAFMKAATGSREQVMEFLISKGAKVDTADRYGSTALMPLAWHGAFRAVELLISKGAKIDAVNNQGETALIQSAYAGQEKVVKLLLSKGANVNAHDKAGNTGLIKAAERGYVNVMELLISNGADVNAANNDSETALMRAVYGNSLKGVELLISKGAEIEKPDKYGRTALFLAADYDRVEIIEFLASKGANLDVVINGGETPLTKAVTLNYDKVVGILLSKGAKVDTSGEEGVKLFFAAAYGGNMKLVELMLSNGMDVNVRGDHDRTALMQSCLGCHIDVCEFLISKGAKVDAVDKSNDSVLNLAASWADAPIIKLLVSKGANVNETNDRGETPLIKAAGSSLIDKIEILLAHGANIDAVDNYGRTALLVAAERGNVKVVEFLIIVNGANIDAVDSKGCTALMIAASAREDETVEFLAMNGANLDLFNNEGETALMMAAHRSQFAIVELLISNGADLDLENENGETALLEAAKCGSEKIVDHLLSKGAKPYNKGDKGAKLLCAAAAGGLLKSVEKIISNGADVDARNSEGASALLKAAENGNAKIVELLIAKGAGADVVDKTGKTALMMAAFSGISEVIELLIEKGAPVNAVDNDGATALIKAGQLGNQISDVIIRGKAAVVPLLIAHGAKADVVVDNSGRTALIMAASAGFPYQVLELLIEKGARVNAADNDGVTALMKACEVSFMREEQSVVTLLEKGAEVDSVNKKGVTALIKAASRGYDKTVEHLIRAGANVDIAENTGWTALMCAADDGQEKVVELLLVNGANTELANMEGKTALMLATEKRHERIVDILKNKSG